MDVGVIVLTLVVGLFGVASAVLGFIAERTKLTVSTSTNPHSTLAARAFQLEWHLGFRMTSNNNRRS